MGLLRNIYLYVVSFVALMITITAVITSFNAISDMIIPDSDVYGSAYSYDYSYGNAEGISVEESMSVQPRPSAEELENQQREREIRGAQKSLINSIAGVLVGGLTYWFHWTRIEREHKNKKETV